MTMTAPLPVSTSFQNNLPTTFHLIGTALTERFAWSISTDPTPGQPVLLSAEWDGNDTVLSYCPSPVGMNAEEADALTNAVSSMTSIMTVFTAFHRRFAHHPGNFGLVPRRLLATQHTSNLPWSVAGDPFMTTLAESVPEELWNGDWGWFDPAADPHAYGTPYLIAIGMADVKWALRQVGLSTNGVQSWNRLDETGIETVAWDDPTEISRLAASCGEDPELLLTMRALEDSDTVANGARSHLFRQQIMAAREHFQPKAKQLRPRLASDAVRDALATCLTSYYLARVEEHFLTPYQVFGYSYGSGSPKQVYAGIGVRITPDRLASGQVTAEQIDQVAVKIQANLDARGLGQAIRVRGLEDEVILVTRDVDAVREFHSAFGLPEGFAYDVIPSNAPAPRARRTRATKAP